MTALLARLRQAIPHDAHAQRLSAAFDGLLPRGASTATAEAAAPLVQLLRGSTLASRHGAATATPFQELVLMALSRIACAPLWMCGLVQPSFLQAHGLVAAAEAALLSAHGHAAASSLERALFLTASSLACLGDQRGARHGCLLVEDDAFPAEPAEALASANEVASDAGAPVASLQHAVAPGLIFGEGWNHEVFEQRGTRGKKRVLHAEAHAVADAMQRHGEAAAFERLQRCTAWIVELRDDAAYDDAPPCRKCRLLLQAVGVPRAVHSTPDGQLRAVEMPPAKPDALATDMAAKPLMYACDAMGVRCVRLERALAAAQEAGGAKMAPVARASRRRASPERRARVS